MRKALVALSLSAFTLSSLGALTSASAAPAKMSKMGCIVGKQKWDAPMAKCVDAKPVKKVSKTLKKKPAVKKAM